MKNFCAAKQYQHSFICLLCGVSKMCLRNMTFMLVCPTPQKKIVCVTKKAPDNKSLLHPAEESSTPRTEKQILFVLIFTTATRIMSLCHGLNSVSDDTFKNFYPTSLSRLQDPDFFFLLTKMFCPEVSFGPPVSTQKSVLKNIHRVLRYCQKGKKVLTFCLKSLFGYIFTNISGLGAYI